MKNFLLEALKNAAGWSTPRKIVVIESDDWGSIRMPSLETREALVAKGYPVDKNYFTRFDRLESADDLYALYAVLEKYKGADGKNPVFTTLNIMGNPDFDAIIKSDYKAYTWQHVDQTYQAYGESPAEMKSAWAEGIKKGLISAQFHGREHVNVPRWMRGLYANLPLTKIACDMHLTGIKPEHSFEQRGEYQASYDIDEPADIPVTISLLEEGLQEFEKYFGYKASYFVPPNGFLSSASHRMLADMGIAFINSSKIEKEPLGNGRFKSHYRWLGKSNKYNQIYITRNVFFEPSWDYMFPDWVGTCMKNIALAFKWKKPAIICSHRVNFVAGIEQGNRDRGLEMLGNLLEAILREWPDVIFMSSDDLGNMIKGRK